MTTATEAHVTVGTMVSGMDLTFPSGSNTIRVTISDMSGNVSTEETFTFSNSPLTPVNRPFETTQLWFIKTDRDIGTLTASATPEGTTKVATPNGTADFDEDIVSLNVGLGYQIWENVVLNSTYTYTNLSTDIPLREYDRHRIAVGASMSF